MEFVEFIRYYPDDPGHYGFSFSFALRFALPTFDLTPVEAISDKGGVWQTLYEPDLILAGPVPPELARAPK